MKPKDKRKRLSAVVMRKKEGDEMINRDVPPEEKLSDEELLKIGLARGCVTISAATACGNFLETTCGDSKPPVVQGSSFQTTLAFGSFMTSMAMTKLKSGSKYGGRDSFSLFDATQLKMILEHLPTEKSAVYAFSSWTQDQAQKLYHVARSIPNASTHCPLCIAPLLQGPTHQPSFRQQPTGDP